MSTDLQTSGLFESKPKVVKGDSPESAHDRFQQEMLSGEKSVETAKSYFHRFSNAGKYIYEVEYWLTSADALAYDAAIAKGETPDKQPLRVQFSNDATMSNSTAIGDAWWAQVSHQGQTHFANENVRNTKPFRITGKYISKNAYFKEGVKEIPEEEKERRRGILAEFKEHGSLDRKQKPQVSNVLPKKQ